MKKHNTFKVVLITILVFMLLTWILPAAYYSSGYVDQGRVQMGLFDLFNYPITAISYFGYIALYVLVVGGLYGVLNKIDAYRVLLDKLVAKSKGKEKVWLSVIMVLLAVLTSVCGLQLGLVIFFPMLISIILLMGYDKVTSALAVVGSTMIGIAGTTFGYGNTNIIMSVLSIKITSEMISKVIILVIGLALLIFNTLMYIKKAKVVESKAKKASTKAVKTTKTTKSTKTTAKTKSSKTTKAASKEEEVIVVKEEKATDTDKYVPAKVSSRKKVTVWPLVVMLSLVFIILILAFISWAGAFSNTAFEKATEAVTGFKVFGFTLFGKLLGTVNAFGAWTVSDMITVMMLAILLLALIYKVKFDDVIDGFVSGVKRALAPALMIILIYTCLVIVTYHPFQLVIYKAILGITKGFNVLTGSIVAILASLFNADPAYAFQSVLPYLTSVVTSTDNYPLVGLVFQSIYGLTMLVAPTSVILMGVLSYLEIPYSKWFKTIWKLLVEFLIILLVIFAIIVLI